MEHARALAASDLGIPAALNAAAYFVDRHVPERGSKVAIECGAERVTYAQLLERVNRVGSALRERLDVRAEERVLLLVLDQPEFVYSFFGVVKIGAVAVPVNTSWRAPDYEYVLNDSRARVLVVNDALLPQIDAIPRGRLPYLRHIVVIGNAPDGARRFADLLADGSPVLQAEATTSDDAAFWLYSSGSTGPPKGCVHLHHDMPVCAELYAKGVLRIRESDRFFSVSKLFFAYGLGNGMYFPLAVGATSILCPEAAAPATVFAVIEEHRPTLLFTVPTIYGVLLAHHRDGGPEFDLASVRVAVSAGEALPAALFERFRQRFGVAILDGLGSSEVLHIFISNRPDAIRPGSSGLVVPGYEAKLLDERGAVVRQGEIGSLVVQGDSTCASYWNKHERTKQAIEGAWIHTGDKYYQDEDGYFWYAGRTDDMLKVGGIWVSPVEVEHALVEHSAVQEAGVVGHQDEDGLVKPLAYVALRRGVDATPELATELHQFLRGRLAGHRRPRWIEFLPELPKTATGKVQRFKLRALSGGRSRP